MDSPAVFPAAAAPISQPTLTCAKHAVKHELLPVDVHVLVFRGDARVLTLGQQRVGRGVDFSIQANYGGIVLTCLYLFCGYLALPCIWRCRQHLPKERPGHSSDLPVRATISHQGVPPLTDAGGRTRQYTRSLPLMSSSWLNRPLRRVTSSRYVFSTSAMCLA